MVDNISKTSSRQMYAEINISLMKTNNVILVLCTCIILLSSFVRYFFCICHLGSFRIVEMATFHTDIVRHTSNTFSLDLMTYQLNIPKNFKERHMVI